MKARLQLWLAAGLVVLAVGGVLGTVQPSVGAAAVVEPDSGMALAANRAVEDNGAAQAAPAFAPAPADSAADPSSPETWGPIWKPDAASAKDPVLAKVEPHFRATLQDQAQADRTTYISVISAAPIDLSGYAETSASTPWPFGRTLTFARLKVGNVVKVAGLAAVLSVEESGRESRPAQDAGPDPDAAGQRALTVDEARAKLAELKRSDAPWDEASQYDQTLIYRGGPKPTRKPLKSATATGGRAGAATSGGSGISGGAAVPGGMTAGPGAQPSGWFDVDKGHNSRAAWLRGWKGEGVKVSVADDSADFVHPDLQNTWAIVNVPAITTSIPAKPASRYNGWIEAFDPYSIGVYAQENATGVPAGQESGWLGSTRYISTTQTAIASRSWDDARGITGTLYSRACFIPLMVAANGAKGVRAAGVACDYKIPRTIKVMRNGQLVSRPVSVSGVLRFGSHPDRWLGNLYNERPGVLLVDPWTSGSYDTVLVDLDNDHDFTDEKPANKEDPTVYRDMDGDGYPDISGGVIHYIADGLTPIPGSYIFGKLAPPPPAWSVVMFAGSFELGDHGTLCSSNVVGQGRLPVDSGLSLAFSDLPGDGRLSTGPNLGAAPNAKLVSVANIYQGGRVAFETGWQFLTRGPEPDRSEDDIQVSSNSYGFSEVDNDGWEDEARIIDHYIRTFNPHHSYQKATGNGGPGYGTTTSPAAFTANLIGASTEFGSTGWDSITKTTQILYGDIIPFSDKGPAAVGNVGVTVAADGAYASGADAINTRFNAMRAWATWGGTSRSTPVSAGNMVLIYQAFKAKHGHWPTWEEARAIMMAGATHRGYDTWTQGAGVIDGGAAAMIAGGTDGVYAMPSQWIAGGYRGKSYPAFADVMMAGDSATGTIALKTDAAKPINMQLSAQRLRRVGNYEFDFQSKPISVESPYHFLTPDYLIPVDKTKIPPGTDLMVVRLNWPMEQFDLAPTEAARYTADNSWRLLVYQHTDIDGDGKLWDDKDGDGVVDKTILQGQPSPYIDGYAPLDWDAGELDRYEFMRFGYNNSTNNNLQMYVNHPLQRWADGIYIGLQHSVRPAAIPQTNFKIRVDFYKYQDWPWLTLDKTTATSAATDDAQVVATMKIPAGTPPGGYDGAILAHYTGNAADIGDHTLVIPVVANVAARFDLSGAITFGGPAADDPDAPYNLGTMRGTFNWGWRNESGDWRFFFLDITKPTKPGTLLLTRNTWADVEKQSDIDTLIYGPTSDRYSDPKHADNATENWSDPDWYGPYTLGLVKGSTARYLGSGRWQFDTVTGKSEEWVTAAVKEGLHEVILHNVLISANKFEVPYTLTLASASVDPTEIRASGKGCADITLTTGMDLPGVVVEAFGMSKPILERNHAIGQDNPDDRASAGYKRTFQVTNASRLAVNLVGQDNTDLDMFVLFDRNKDGVFDYPGESVGESTGSTAVEAVEIRRPADGMYAVWVQGWNVPSGASNFNLDIVYPAGNSLTAKNVPSGPVAAGTPMKFQLCYDIPVGASADLYGEAQIGLPGVPGLFTVPVRPYERIYLPMLRRGQ